MKTKITKSISIIAILLLSVALTFCKKDNKLDQAELKSTDNIIQSLPQNPSPEEFGKIPSATVTLKEYTKKNSFKAGSVTSSLTPEQFETTLRSGESVSELLTATVASVPPKADILLMMDLTGSMGGELSNVKVNSANIMNSISSEISDAAFGLVSHMDYPNSFNSCGYNNVYGSSYYGDYPYLLDKNITADMAQVTAAINSKSLGNGMDMPESYARVLYEVTADNGIGWRIGSRKFVVAWLDAPPHDCALGTGTDPGRDAIAGNSDDLAMANVLSTMATQNINLIVLNSGETYWYPQIFTIWQAYAAATGGASFQINPDGTIPGGIDIGQYITEKILEQTGTVDELTVQVCTPGFENWLTNVIPASYTNIDLTSSFTNNFNATIKAPDGTADGLYEFDICLMGDGAEYGRQHVKIHVVNSIPVPFDIKPAGCPNPINRFALGVLPTAILGFTGFNVADVDISTVKLEGISPINSSYQDVGAPFYPFINKPLNSMSCNTLGPDGLMDLTLHFTNSLFLPLLAGYQIGDVVTLHLSGNLINGTPIEGEDVVVIVK